MSKLFGSVVVLALGIVAGCGGDDSSDNDGSGGAQSGGAANKGGAANERGGRNNAGGSGATGGLPPTDAGAGAGAGGEGAGGSNPSGGSANGGSGATDGGVGETGGTDAGGSAGNPNANGGSAGKATRDLKVSAPASALALDACGATPAVLADVAAGTYDIELTASNLSKGSVSDTHGNQSPSFDDYVIVNLPLPAGAPNEEMRFFMLHGVGDKVNVTLPVAGPVNIYFIDGDKDFNTGQATVSVQGGDEVKQVTVDAAANAIAWKTSCLGTAPATVTTSSAPQRVTLVASTYSSGTQLNDQFVLLRVNNEMQVNDQRFTMLNGIGSTYDYTPYEGDVLRAWLISAKGSGTGSAQLKVEDR